MEASRIQFTCANPEKSEKTQKKIQSIMAEEEGKLDFDRHKSHPIPAGMLVSLVLNISRRVILLFSLYGNGIRVSTVLSLVFIISIGRILQIKDTNVLCYDYYKLLFCIYLILQVSFCINWISIRKKKFNFP